MGRDVHVAVSSLSFSLSFSVLNVSVFFLLVPIQLEAAPNPDSPYLQHGPFPFPILLMRKGHVYVRY